MTERPAGTARAARAGDRARRAVRVF